MALLLLAAGLAMAGCAGGDSANPTTVSRVAFSEGSAITTGMTRSAVRHQLGEPVLTSRPTDSAQGGCLYYAMHGQPLANVWQFCFDNGDRVSSGVTLYSIAEPPPPSDASAARTVLIARGDTICQAERADLADPARRLNRQLARAIGKRNRVDRISTTRLFERFRGVLKKTLSELEAFEPPADKRSAFGRYLMALRGQTRLLPRAAAALAALQDQRYKQLVRRFSSLGTTATAHARQYGFSTCAGVTFS